MKRREFIAAALGGAAAMWPQTVRSQQLARSARVGFLGSPPNTPMIIAGYEAFSSQMRQLG